MPRMSRSSLGLSDALNEYLRDAGVREPPVLAELRKETAKLPSAQMQISSEQGAFLAMLVRLIGARRCIEVGVFTGYSSTAVALALPADGRIVACDVSEEWTAMARRAWKSAGVAEKIDLRLAPATATLAGMRGETGTYDFAFIDADKENYESYYELCLGLLRAGGLIAVDNTLWGGSVIDPRDTREPTLAIRAFNAARREDQRVDLSMLPVGDGITLLRKR
jgi:predicted O-methyltransferase YrrM